MNKITILKGLPGSGKTSWAMQQLVNTSNTIRVNKDDIRAMLFGKSSRKKWHEALVLNARDSIISTALADKRNVIVDDTNFNPIHEKEINRLVEHHNANASNRVDVAVRAFETPLDECIANDLKRARSVGERVIRQMHEQYIRPTLKIEQNPDRDDAVIFDLDGTLALPEGRNPYDASTCEYDKLNEPVFDNLRRYQDGAYKIIICSGRSSQYLAQTDRWLGKHGIKPDLFLMRKEGDVRRDSVIKREMFIKHILPNYSVNVVYDDREQVVDMWRDIGLTVYQVSEGRF